MRVLHKYVYKYWDLDSYDGYSDSIFPSVSYGATQYDIDHKVSTANRYNVQQQSIKVIDDKVFGN